MTEKIREAKSTQNFIREAGGEKKIIREAGGAPPVYPPCYILNSPSPKRILYIDPEYLTPCAHVPMPPVSLIRACWVAGPDCIEGAIATTTGRKNLTRAKNPEAIAIAFSMVNLWVGWVGALTSSTCDCEFVDTQWQKKPLLGPLGPVHFVILPNYLRAGGRELTNTN